MSFEITCGECSGQLLVESGGVVVECPLCGAHLSIPEMPETETPPATPEIVAQPTTADSQILAQVAPPHAVEPPVSPKETATLEVSATETSPAVPPAVESTATTEMVTPDTPPPAGLTSDPEATVGWTEPQPPTVEEPVAAVPEPPDFETQVVIVTETPSVADSVMDETAEAPASSAQVIGLSEDPTQILDRALHPFVGGDVVPTENVAITMNGTELVSPASPSPAASRPAATAAPADAAAELPVETVPRQHFILVAGYASAVTLALLYMIFAGMTSKPHFLESLPDLVPEIRKDGAVGMPRVLPHFDLPPGHELKLGESQRFGNVVVTPVKVTRGPLKFVHAYGNKNAALPQSGPVLKLWLKLENVSKNQEFPPLDRTLIYRRIYDPKLQADFALPFLCSEPQRKAENGEHHLVYDMPEFSEFLLEGQQIDRWLNPGETYETYIPSQENLSQVSGPWVWRVLLRKGLNPKSGRGVTTLFDVKFSADQITAES